MKHLLGTFAKKCTLSVLPVKIPLLHSALASKLINLRAMSSTGSFNLPSGDGAAKHHVHLPRLKSACQHVDLVRPDGLAMGRERVDIKAGK